MKSNLVAKIIEAHYKKDEKGFEEALLELANDEEKKGNFSVSSNFKKILKTHKNSITTPNSKNMKSTVNLVFPQSVSSSVPKDRDNSLELIEIFYPQITFQDIALTEKNNEIFNQIVREQKESDRLASAGVAPSNRVLMFGPPGCGKTTTAYALANELKLPVAYVKLDGLVSSYLGQTGTNIRKIFDFVKDKEIMLFLDEFDAIAKKRDDSQELGELKRVVTTLLQNFDSLPPNVFLVAATNHHHLLDPAIWRRFDVLIHMDYPDQNQKSSIINKHLNTNLLNFNLNTSLLDTLTKGMSGSDIEIFMNSLVKHIVLNDVSPAVNDKIVFDIWAKNQNLFLTDSSEEVDRSLLILTNKGIKYRDIEKLTGIKKSTANYRINKINRK